MERFVTSIHVSKRLEHKRDATFSYVTLAVELLTVVDDASSIVSRWQVADR
jgi:hypothetical protein